MRIDSHQHFWDYTHNAAHYDWIDDSMRRIRADFLPADLAPLLAASGFDGSVAVEARQSVDESRWLLSLAANHPAIKAVVGWAPLASPSLAACLDELCANLRFRGVRHVVQAEPDPAFLDGADFNAGIRQLAARGLVYDLLVKAHQLPAALRFVDRHPNQSFVLDHIAKPVVTQVVDPEWLRHFRELARRPNVSCKFSGVVTEVPDWRWSQEMIRVHFDCTLEAFGADRVMFGSDWPVCLVATDHRAWVSAVEACAKRLSTSEQASLFGDTAARIYGIRS